MSHRTRNQSVTSTRSQPSLDRSDAFVVLGDPRRRHLLAVLDAISLPADRGRLATLVAEREDASERRVAISLAHVHLPLLADLGAIHYDRDTGLVTTVDDELLRLARDGWPSG